MPIPEQRDLEKARGIVAGWLAERIPGATDVEVGPISGPALHRLLERDPALRRRRGRPTEHDAREGLVVRVKPTAHTVFLESDFEWQYRVLEALGTRDRRAGADDALVRGRRPRTSARRSS